jgi:hypothetical protein
MTNLDGFASRRALLARLIALVIAVAAVVPASVPAFAAPIGWNAFGGWYTDPRNFELGAGARIGFGSVTFNPNAEYIFTENATSYTLNLDGTMSVMPLGVASVYAGGGVTWATQDPDNGDSHTDSGINVLAGAGLNAIPFKPYGQIKWAFLPDDTPFSFSFGVRF